MKKPSYLVIFSETFKPSSYSKLWLTAPEKKQNLPNCNNYTLFCNSVQIDSSPLLTFSFERNDKELSLSVRSEFVDEILHAKDIQDIGFGKNSVLNEASRLLK